MRLFLFLLSFLQVAVFLFPYSPKTHPISLSHLPPLAIGDWVLRHGTSGDSFVISGVSESNYSHIGMIIEATPEPIVIHAITDEGNNKENQVITTPLANFLSPSVAKDYIIIRPTFITHEQQQNIKHIVITHLNKPFVLSSREQKPLYCTTLLYDAIKTEIPTFSLTWRLIDIPLLKGEYLFPQAFLDYPHTQIIYKSISDTVQ